MTTTSRFQKKSDYYSSKEGCIESIKKYITTNPRYKHFQQTHFTAGDEDQFQRYRDPTNGQICIPEISIENNRFQDKDLLKEVWKKYKNLTPLAVNNTFRYMFNQVCDEIGFNMNDLNKDYCYSFVMQHPRNRIVKVIKSMKLYLVDVYEIIDNKTINIIPLTNIELFGIKEQTVKIINSKMTFFIYSLLFQPEGLNSIFREQTLAPFYNVPRLTGKK